MMKPSLTFHGCHRHFALVLELLEHATNGDLEAGSLPAAIQTYLSILCQWVLQGQGLVCLEGKWAMEHTQNFFADLQPRVAIFHNQSIWRTTGLNMEQTSLLQSSKKMQLFWLPIMHHLLCIAASFLSRCSFSYKYPRYMAVDSHALVVSMFEYYPLVLLSMFFALVMIC